MGMFGFRRSAAPAANLFATATAYQPTLRDKAANQILQYLGDNPFNQNAVAGLLGSHGLGQDRPGVVDFIPGLGQIFQADEGGRQIARGQPLRGAANVALAAIPVPAAAKGAKAAAREVKAALRGADGKVRTFYHGSPSANLTQLTAGQDPDPARWGFTPVVSVSTDPKFAARYAGPQGRVYQATIHTDQLGDFADPNHLASARDFFKQKYGGLDAYDQEALQHGAWRLWEDPELWAAHGWHGAWVREEPGGPLSNSLNLSLGSGDHVQLQPPSPFLGK